MKTKGKRSYDEILDLYFISFLILPLTFIAIGVFLVTVVIDPDYYAGIEIEKIVFFANHKLTGKV